MAGVTQDTPFFAAIRAGDISAVKDFVAKDPTIVNICNQHNCTPLTFSICFQQPEIGMFLIEEGGVDSANDQQAFYNAISRCRDAGAKAPAYEALTLLLIEKGADVLKAPHADGKAPPPLIMALRSGAPKSVAVALLAKGAGSTIDWVQQGCDETMLSLALYEGDEESALFLIENGADVNATDGTDTNRTPLILAIEQFENPLEIVRQLIAKGAKVNATDADGGTPLEYAARRLDASLVELLLENGATVAPKEDAAAQEMAAKDHTAGVGRPMPFARPPVDTTYTPLHAVTERTYSTKAAAVAKLLCSKGGIAVDCVAASTGNTPLINAVKTASKVARTRGGAGPFGVTHLTSTPAAVVQATPPALEWSEARAPVIRVLLAEGANPSIANLKGETALSIAEKTGCEALVTLLTRPEQ